MTLVLLLVTLDAKKVVIKNVQQVVKDAMADVKKVKVAVVRYVKVAVKHSVQAIVKALELVVQFTNAINLIKTIEERR